MSALEPVSFSRRREAKPRLSKPYVPGRHDKRYWTEAEDEVIRKYFTAGGAAACLAHLPPHRTPSGVYRRAEILDVKAPPSRGGGRHGRIEVPEDIDDRIRAEWAHLSGRKNGDVAELAGRLGVPRWWLTKRATTLGLVTPHRKEPPWTPAEEELLRKLPLHNLDRSAQIMREHGFSRSPSAIAVRAKRLDLSRRATRETLAAGAAAKILGIDSKTVTAWCIAGELKATRREDRRLPQQGGSAWDIRPEDLRQFVIDRIERIDIRKVDKVAFVHLLTTAPAASLAEATVPTEAPAPAAPKPQRRRPQHEAGTVVGDLERQFAAAGVDFEYSAGPRASSKPCLVGGRRMTLAQAIAHAGRLS